MQFLVNYTLSEVIFNTIDQRWKKTSCEDISESKEISISCKYGTFPAHQLLEVLHKNGIILDKVQVANNLLVLSCPSFIGINLSFVEYVVFLFLHLFDNCCKSYLHNRENGISKVSAI